jgi:hypothetical protein
MAVCGVRRAAPAHERAVWPRRRTRPPSPTGLRGWHQAPGSRTGRRRHLKPAAIAGSPAGQG